MHLAYGVYNLTLGLELWMVNYETIPIILVTIAFHIMTAVGGVVGAMIYRKIEIFRIHVSTKNQRSKSKHFVL